MDFQILNPHIMKKRGKHILSMNQKWIRKN